MNKNGEKAISVSSLEEDSPLHFSEWLKRRRRELDLTQEQLAQRVSCSVFAIRKIESGERQPSKQLAGLLAQSLEIPSENQATFIKAARGEMSMKRLASLARTPSRDPLPAVNLPKSLTPFIGREPELLALGQMLCDPQCLLLTIVGPGGIGKTRLAIEAANQFKDHFPDGVWFVPLAALNSPALLISAIADAMQFGLQGTAPPQTQLLRYLCQKRSLIVLDNAEHLLEGVDLFTQILNACPQVKLLVTSRERLSLLSEWVFEITGLPVPPDDRVEQFESYSSVALFLQSARRLCPGFRLDETNRSAIADICHLVEGMPLAIELAATWIPTLSLSEIKQEIRRSLDFLSTAMRDLPERHRSMRAVFEHSWRLLNEQAQQALCRLSVFRGGFTREAAEQVAGASLPILMSLLSKSLLLHREDGRYDLHELIRQCTLEKLRDSGYLEETCHKHLDYFVSMFLDAHQGMRSALLANWLKRIEQEHDNIRAALEWAFSPTAPSERVEEGLGLMIDIDRFWAARGHVREGLDWAERGMKASDIAPLHRADALRFSGWLHVCAGEEQAAIAPLQESVMIGRQLNDVICQAKALDTLADVAWLTGDFAKAKAYYAESLELYRKGGDPQGIGLSLASAGRLHVDYGYCQEAELLLAEGLALLQTVSDFRGIAWCFKALGRSALLQGDVTLAAERFRQSLRLNLDLGYMPDLTEGLHELAVVEAIAGDESKATILRAAATALQSKFGFNSSTNTVVYLRAPDAWFQTAPFSEEWKKGEMMSLDEAIAYALEHVAE